ncbi:unnamed protein product [Strongylus vulgaris]|uniref:Uncharacterized protein n=1 Tax=Strongylus vulgaris TaxID=40348 RepID=A0A3P7JAY8_STRVU|nr:unnamed protein product [Strongylus vulgaris]
MPVRRPTAYVSDKNSNDEKEDDEDKDGERKTSPLDVPKKPATPDQRLLELSMKYRQQNCSPDRATLTSGTKATCG